MTFARGRAALPARLAALSLVTIARSAVFALAVVLGLAGDAAAAVAVWPLEVHLASAPGQEASAELRVVNRSPIHQEVAVSLTDWEVEGGDRVIVPPGSGSRSLTPFLLGGLPPRLQLAPGETVRLTVTVRRPPGDGGTRWLGVAVVSEMQGAASSDTSGVRLLRRQLVRMYHTPLPLTPVRGTIAAIAPPPHPPGVGRWTADYVNPTDRVVTVQGEWRLTDAAGRPMARGALGPFLAYPGRRPVPFGPVPDLPPGTYHLLVLATPEGGDTAAGELRLHVHAKEEPAEP